MKGWEGDTFEESREDEFETPRWLVELCVSELNRFYFPELCVSILDPAAGRSVWANVLNKQIKTLNYRISECEINDDRGNFYDNYTIYNWVIGNPPFSNLTRWLEHSTKIADTGIGYILPAHALNHKRLEMMESFGFTLCSIHSFRNPKEWDLGYPHFFCVWLNNFASNIVPRNHVMQGPATNYSKQYRMTEWI